MDLKLSSKRGIRTIKLKGYPNNYPPRKIALRLELGFESRSGLVLGFGGNQTIAPKENCPLVRVRVWLRVSFGVGGQFSSGVIVLEPTFYLFSAILSHVYLFKIFL